MFFLRMLRKHQYLHEIVLNEYNNIVYTAQMKDEFSLKY